jgi:hypothetical protein
MEADSFPKRAFVQVFYGGRMNRESTIVTKEMNRRGIDVFTFETEDILSKPLPLTRNDLVVGDFDWTRMALKQLKIKMPNPPDYPECLNHLLKRKVWKSTLQKVLKVLETATENIFIKPAADIKAFNGIVEPKE